LAKREEDAAPVCQRRDEMSPVKLFSAGVLAVILLCGAGAHAQAPAQLQILVRVDGTVPDWSQTTLSGSGLQVDGSDTNLRRFSVTASQPAGSLAILRTAAGSNRFLVGATIPAGRVDQIRLTLGTAIVTLTNTAAVPPRFPLAITSGKALLQPPERTLTLAPGETRSLAVSIVLGGNAVLQKGVLNLPPTLSTEVAPTPTPENFLNGSETVEGSITETFPELGVNVVRAKVIDPVAGDVRDMTLRGGAPVSFSDLRSQNEALWRTHHGFLDNELVQRLTSVSGDAVVLADVWFRVPGAQTFQTDAVTGAASDAAHTTFVNERHLAAAPVATSLSAALTTAGATVLSTELNPPVLHIQATRSVLEAVSHLSDVLQITATQLPQDRHALMTSGATDLVQTPLDLAHLLLAGKDLRIAVAEDGACVSTGHEVFQGVTWEAPVGDCQDAGPAYNGGHSTAVAGALAGFVPATSPGDPNTTRPPQGDTAGLVGLFQGHLLTANLCGSINDALLSRNPDLVNVSCVSGQLVGPVDHSSKVPYDYAVFHDRVFIASGAGNIDVSADQSQQYVLCPSYNAVCVSGYLHHDTLGPGNFGDDTTSERFLNDPATKREKPDLVGPSGGVFPLYKCPSPAGACTDQSASFQFPNHAYEARNGTSFSTPFVTGTAALIMANYESYLVNNPTLLRGVLMASARHSFTGQPVVPLFNDTIDDKAGAGAPRGDRAKNILENQNFFPPADPSTHKVSGLVDRNVDFDSAGNLIAPISFIVSAGSRVRVVLTYDQCQVDTVSLNDTLDADLDLVVKEDAPNVHITHVNNSHLDNTEIVDFSVGVQSQITVKTKVQSWSACADGSHKTYMAIVWDVMGAGDQ
jgi:hypothetical protein